MIELPITIDHLSQLFLNVYLLEIDKTLDLPPVAKLIIPQSDVEALVVSMTPDFNMLYGLFTFSPSKPQLTKISLDELLLLSKKLNKPIICDDTWRADKTISQYYKMTQASL